MITADFEESEFRGPLYNQLEWGNHLVWEPGQVFEKHIGIDRASYVTNPFFWGMLGYGSPLGGVLMFEYDWDWDDLWKKRLKNKVLPDFSLNLFIQAKRPYAGKQPKGKIRKNGIIGDYWKFKITPHQQAALERMSNKIGSKALVCYAAPAFHTQAALYEHTKNKSIVQNSTFPKALDLVGHGAWYYDKGGASGVANPDFVAIEAEPIDYQIYKLVQEWTNKDSDAVKSLRLLAGSLVASAREIREPSPADTWFQLLLARTEEFVKDITSIHDKESEHIAALRHYLQVRAFCNAYHLQWFVIGKGF